MKKSEKYSDHQNELARFAKAISNPARLAILEYLAETKTCISGDITDFLPLSRSTASQHLKELRDIGLIQGEIEGLKINYCICQAEIKRFLELLNNFFNPILSLDASCETAPKTKKTARLAKAAVVVKDEIAPEIDKSKDIFFF